MRVSQVGAVEPGHRLTEICNAGIDFAGYHLGIATRTFCCSSVIGQWTERQRLAATTCATLWIALVAIRQPHAPQADNARPNITEGGAMLDGAAAIF